MLGLARPDAGTVTRFGLPPAQTVASGPIGGMLQTGSLIEHHSVRELLEVVAPLYPTPLGIAEPLEATGTSPFASQRTTSRSGGQTQRVRLALALVANPDLLVLDEPAAALDVEARRDLWSAVRAIARSGRAVVFATHCLEGADAYATRIDLRERGRNVPDGPATEITARVGGRTIRATLPDADLAAVGGLPGVAGVERRGEAVVISCGDSDVTLRALFAGSRLPVTSRYPVRGRRKPSSSWRVRASDRCRADDPCDAPARRGGTHAPEAPALPLPAG